MCVNSFGVRMWWSSIFLFLKFDFNFKGRPLRTVGCVMTFSLSLIIFLCNKPGNVISIVRRPVYADRALKKEGKQANRNWNQLLRKLFIYVPFCYRY